MQREINKIISSGKESRKELIPGYGDDIFCDTLNYIQNNYIKADLLKLDSYQRHDWDAIANKVWFLGCAMTPKRV